MENTKFRAWDKRNKKMMLNPHVCNNNYKTTPINLVFTDNEWIYMQYIGVKDKNEEEIYASDIVKYQDEAGNKQTGVVIDLVWKVYVEAIGGDDEGNQDLEMHPDYDYEVIGNIYKNKDLLIK